ncbi:flagellar hook-basal body complex protein [Bacillus sp. JJ1532]|uniref:flagellar hook protein FlgE n=1 Tax=unclassified Bacillus (in: firmicutes) TaxID=185979 RepID=UPI003000A8EA
MLRSMYSGISGLRNFQTKLDVIGNNIANVNTAGFKKGRVTFKDAMSQTIAGASASTENRGGKNSMQVGLGSSLSTIDTIHTGSSLQTTNRPQDLAIEGDGYFVVKQGNAEFYTRAGNFYLDDNGTLVNGDGYKVQAYQVNDGKVSNTYGNVTINVNALLPATTTSKIDIAGNLDPNTLKDEVFTQQVKVVDTKGKEHTIDVKYKKDTDPDSDPTVPQTWNVYFGKDTTGTEDLVITFPLDPTTPPTITGDITLSDGTTISGTDLTLSVEELTSTAGSGISVMAAPNGFTAGKLESFSIGAMGEINGVYSNGQISTLGRLAIAKFSNTSGLNKTGGNLFQETISSGPANVGAAGEGRGTIASGALEMSNVDLSEEFTEMITAQRGFQANTRIITTSDEILQELVNLKR